MFSALLVGVQANNLFPKNFPLPLKDRLPKSFPITLIGIVRQMNLVPDARVLYVGLPSSELFEAIYLNAPQAKIDLSPDGGEYDNVLVFIAPESRPSLAWASHLKQGGIGGVLAVPLFLEGPFPFPDYLGMLKEMHMGNIYSMTRHLSFIAIEPIHKFRKWIEESIIIPFGVPPSEELIDRCIALASTNQMIDRAGHGGPYVFTNEIQIILFERL
jgi:hypothetical protein